MEENNNEQNQSQNQNDLDSQPFNDVVVSSAINSIENSNNENNSNAEEIEKTNINKENASNNSISKNNTDSQVVFISKSVNEITDIITKEEDSVHYFANLDKIDYYHSHFIEPPEIRLKHFCSVNFPLKFHQSWMRGLNDELFISQVSILGSHDTTSILHSYFDYKNQSWKLKDQLLAGVRYLDLRLGLVNNALLLFHSQGYNKISFLEVLDDIEEFLRKYPSEFIIIRIKEELKPLGNSNIGFLSKLKEYFIAFDDLFLLKKEVPTIKEARGKIWLMQNKFDIGCYDWDNAVIQDDFWLEPREKLNVKKDLIKSFLKMTGEKGIYGDGKFYINHFSGSAAGKGYNFPFEVALHTNSILLDLEEKQFLGIVLFDFISDDLIEKVIDMNILKFNK